MTGKMIRKALFIDGAWAAPAGAGIIAVTDPATAVNSNASADMPLAVATAPIPPSRLARRSSKQATVGLEMRE